MYFQLRSAVFIRSLEKIPPQIRAAHLFLKRHSRNNYQVSSPPKMCYANYIIGLCHLNLRWWRAEEFETNPDSDFTLAF